MQYLIQFAFCLQFLAPYHAHAQELVRPLKEPSSYSLGQYAFVFGVSMLGGLVSWIGKVRRKEVETPTLSGLVGELTISAFVGLLAFYACEAAGASALVTPCVVGVAGHMGTKLILMAEAPVQKFLEGFFQSKGKL